MMPIASLLVENFDGHLIIVCDVAFTFVSSVASYTKNCGGCHTRYGGEAEEAR